MHLCYSCLGSVFPHLVTLKVRQEHLVLAEIQRRIPELWDYFEEWDCPIFGGCSLKRPDMLWELPFFFFIIEIDEGGNAHEDDRERLDRIHRDLGLHRPGHVLRINPEGMLAKRQHQDGEVKYAATKEFEGRMDVVEAFIRQRVISVDLLGVQNPYNCPLLVNKLFFD